MAETVESLQMHDAMTCFALCKAFVQGNYDDIYQFSFDSFFKFLRCMGQNCLFKATHGILILNTVIIK